MPKNWIDDVLCECEHVETPRSWLYWSLLCAISAAAGNNYYLNILKGAVTVKPNIYVILMGESGLGKEFPVALTRTLVQRADVTRVIAGRSSIQAIIKELSQSKTREKKALLEDSRGFIVNGELSTGIIEDPDSLTILTDLYTSSSNPEWVNLLKGDGKEKLKYPYITALFGTSPAHFYDSIPQVNIEGGYIGRNIIVEEKVRYKDTDMLDANDADAANTFPYDKFFPHLELIAGSSARMLVDTEAKVVFNQWRSSFRQSKVQDRTGFTNRVPEHVLKLAMLLTLSEYNTDFLIKARTISEAIEQVTSLTYSSNRVAEGTGKDPLAAQQKMILDFLLNAEGNTLRRKQLLTKGYGNYDSLVLDKIIDNLVEIGWVNRERLSAGIHSDWIYTMEGTPLEAYKKFMSRRKKDGTIKDRED